MLNGKIGALTAGFVVLSACEPAPAPDEAEWREPTELETVGAALNTEASGVPWAVVGADGALVRGGEVVDSLQLSPGRYEVRFNRDVSGCGYTTTIGDTGNTLVYHPGWTFTAGGHTSVEHVYVETKNPGGGLQSYPFHLTVSCGSKLPWAVVDGNGIKMRGGMVKSTTRLGPGRYEVEFKKKTADCGYTATIGDTGNALVYDPGLVFTAGGHSGDRHVYVETKNPGGGLQDYPFHLAVSCGSSSRWAVVDGNGVKVEGGMVKSTYQLGPGRYEVEFKKNVGQCAYTATIGDVASGLVYDPGLVFTAGGHTSTSHVYVETKNPGGGLQSYPFHLAVSCSN